MPDDVQKDLDVHWRHVVSADLVDGWVTSPLRTVLDCICSLPADEGLAIADSALRSGRGTRLAPLGSRGIARGGTPNRSASPRQRRGWNGKGTTDGKS